MSEIALTAHQRHAIDTICALLKQGERVVAIRGLAGTGKTALIPALTQQIEATMQAPTVIGAPTHRAANILRQKGLHDADTVHSLALMPLFAPAYNAALEMLAPESPSTADAATPQPSKRRYDDTGETLMGNARRAWLRLDLFPSQGDMLMRAGLH